MERPPLSSNTPQLWLPSFEGAIFDFDGTIANTAWIWEEVDRAFLGSRGIPYTREYARALSVLGFGAGALYTIETYGLDETPEDICDEWTKLSRALYHTSVTLRHGVEEYILALRALGIPTALATVNEPELISGMQQVDVANLFDVRVHGCEVRVPKDQPDIYLEAARRMGVAPQRCIVFEDIAPGIRAAHEAGFLTCAVRSGDKTQILDEVRDAAELSLMHWTDIKLDNR